MRQCGDSCRKPNQPTGEALEDADAFLTPSRQQRNASLDRAQHDHPQPEVSAACACCHLERCLLSSYQSAVLKNNRTVTRDIASCTRKINLTKFEGKVF